jgi:hypothetical protein
MNTIAAAQNFGDIFYLRERMIQDILHKKNLEKIKSRVSELHNINININSYSNKSKRKKKPKKKKSSDLILPTIYENIYINSNINLNTNSDEEKETEKEKENQSNKKLFSPNHLSLNSSKVILKEEYARRYKESKRRNEFLKLQEIQKENQFLLHKLQNISSPLNKNNLNNSYEKFEAYRNIAKNTKSIREVQKKADNVKEHLPLIIFDKKIPVNYIYCSNFTEGNLNEI